MKGVGVLRVGLGQVEQSMVPLHAASFAYRSRSPMNLDGLERLLIEHLVAVEDVLAHVRRMKAYEERGND